MADSPASLVKDTTNLAFQGAFLQLLDTSADHFDLARTQKTAHDLISASWKHDMLVIAHSNPLAHIWHNFGPILSIMGFL